MAIDRIAQSSALLVSLLGSFDIPSRRPAGLVWMGWERRERNTKKKKVTNRHNPSPNFSFLLFLHTNYFIIHDTSYVDQWRKMGLW